MNHSGNELAFLQTKWMCELRGKVLNTVVLPSSRSVLLKTCLQAKSNFY